MKRLASLIIFMLLLISYDKALATKDKNKMLSGEELQTLVKEFGEWLQRCEERFGEPKGGDALPCINLYTISSEEKENIEVVKEFGKWIESCSQSEMVNSDEEFKSCIYVKGVVEELSKQQR